MFFERLSCIVGFVLLTLLWFIRFFLEDKLLRVRWSPILSFVLGDFQNLKLHVKGIKNLMSQEILGDKYIREFA